MVNLKKLKAKMVEEDVTAEQAAKYLDIDISTMYRRLNGESKFIVDEVERLSELLHLTAADAMAIFFASIVA